MIPYKKKSNKLKKRRQKSFARGRLQRKLTYGVTFGQRLPLRRQVRLYRLLRRRTRFLQKVIRFRRKKIAVRCLKRRKKTRYARRRQRRASRRSLASRLSLHPRVRRYFSDTSLFVRRLNNSYRRVRGLVHRLSLKNCRNFLRRRRLRGYLRVARPRRFRLRRRLLCRRYYAKTRFKFFRNSSNENRAQKALNLQTSLRAGSQKGYFFGRLFYISKHPRLNKKKAILRSPTQGVVRKRSRDFLNRRRNYSHAVVKSERARALVRRFCKRRRDSAPTHG